MRHDVALGMQRDREKEIAKLVPQFLIESLRKGMWCDLAVDVQRDRETEQRVPSFPTEYIIVTEDSLLLK